MNNRQLVLEADYNYSFSRPALGENFRANHCNPLLGAGMQDVLASGEEVLELDTGWETGLRHFVVPVGAIRLELVERGSAWRCDLVRFVDKCEEE